MQIIVNQYIRHGLNCLPLQSVTYSCLGNNPANDLVTEILHYFTIACFVQNGKSPHYKPIKFNSHQSVFACFDRNYSYRSSYLCNYIKKVRRKYWYN